MTLTDYMAARVVRDAEKYLAFWALVKPAEPESRAYYCGYCAKSHRRDSQVGKAHIWMETKR